MSCLSQLRELVKSLQTTIDYLDKLDKLNTEKKIMKSLAVDIGYGHVKVVLAELGHGITQKYKFTSLIAEVEKHEIASDNRIISFEDKHYYVGDDAVNLPSNTHIDMKDYANLEFAAPLFLAKVLTDIDPSPDRIVLGLSIAQINNSGHYLKRVNKFLKESGIKAEVLIVPQGMIAKVAVDEYGLEFPNKPKEFAAYQNYLLLDVGNDTLDIITVLGGKTSSSSVHGIPGRGIRVMTARLIKHIKNETGVTLSEGDGREVLYRGHMTRRGKLTSFEGKIKELKKEYISELMTITENKFGEVLDKMSSFIIIGGGAYFLEDIQDDFCRVPNSDSEYYNAIGMSLHGLK